MMELLKTIYAFEVPSIDGGTINFADFKGKKILIVNTASECGFTSQYAQLQQLFETYQPNTVVVGFPSNDFGGQEPDSDATIAQFCQINFGVTFPLAAKSSVHGKAINAVFNWLLNQDSSVFNHLKVEWNFQKFLINEFGQLVGVFDSSVAPLDNAIVSLLTA